MEYLGRSARVPHGDGTWSKFMPIREAEKYEHNLLIVKKQQVVLMACCVKLTFLAQQL